MIVTFSNCHDWVVRKQLNQSSMSATLPCLLNPANSLRHRFILLNWGSLAQSTATRPFPAWTPSSLLNPYNSLQLECTLVNEGSCLVCTAAQLGVRCGNGLMSTEDLVSRTQDISISTPELSSGSHDVSSRTQDLRIRTQDHSTLTQDLSTII